MSEKRQKFSPDFKHNAVQLATPSDRFATDIARDLGIRPKLLYRWRSELQAKSTSNQTALASPGNPQELTQLRKKVTELQEEVAILKKAAAYFSN